MTLGAAQFWGLAALVGAVGLLSVAGVLLLVFRPWYARLAFRYAFPARRPPSWFLLFAVSGVALGVMLMVVVMSVMGGLGDAYRESMVKTNGHLLVRGARHEGGQSFPDRLRDWPAALAGVAALPGVEAVAPRLSGPLMAQTQNVGAPAFLTGVDPAEGWKVLQLEPFMVAGSTADLDDESVLLSARVARDLQIWALGQTVEVYTMKMLELARQDEVLLPRELRVAGVFQTNDKFFDQAGMVGTLRLAQELFADETVVQELSVRLRPGVSDTEAAAAVRGALGPAATVLTWQEMNAAFLYILQFEKNMIFFMLLFVAIVSAFVIAVAQFLTVIRKTREIGLIDAMGGSAFGVWVCFSCQGYFVGLVGSAVGLGLAHLALTNRDAIIEGIARFTGGGDSIGQAYQFAESLPFRYAADDLVLILGCSILLATLAGLVPAWRASRLRAADALKADA